MLGDGARGLARQVQVWRFGALKEDQARIAVTGAHVKREGQSVPVNITALPVVRRQRANCSACQFRRRSYTGARSSKDQSNRQRTRRGSFNSSRSSKLCARSLQSAVRELEIANEEHKAINEEAMSVNEEFQSTNEELETSKEELQSLNEELSSPQ